MCLQLFSHILKREFQENDTKHLSRKFTEWVYGPVTCSLYDLASVDSYQKNSALEILVYGSDVPVSPISISISPQSVSCVSELWTAVFHQNRHEMIQTAPLGQLLESKWKKFAGQMFCLNFLFYLVYLIVFTAVAYNKNEGQVSLQQHLLRLVGEDTPAFTDLCIVLLPTADESYWTYLFRIHVHLWPATHSTGKLLLLYHRGMPLPPFQNKSHCEPQEQCALSQKMVLNAQILDMRRKRPKLQTLLIDGYYEILLWVLHFFLFIPLCLISAFNNILLHFFNRQKWLST